MQSKKVFSSLLCGLTVWICVQLQHAHASEDCFTSQALIVLDKSSSMTNTGASGDTLWVEAVDSVNFMTSNYQEAIDFGLMIFPYPNQCSPGQVVVEMGPNNSAAISSEMQDPPPTSGNWTPMAQSLDAAADHTPLHVDYRPSFVILITDGWQWCSPYDPATRFLPVESVENLAALGIPVYVVGFTQSVDALTLNRMAVAGGTAHVGCDVTATEPNDPNNCYFQADDYFGLADALETIALEVVHERPCGSSVGECEEGIQTCRNGKWGECVGEVGPTEEVCDGRDNNCNGITDEGCDCMPGETRPCGTDVGECRQGVQVCDEHGKWSENCDGAILPTDEVCDGKDNNCNGLIDDGDNLCDPGWICVNGECVPVGGPEKEEELENGKATTPAACGCRAPGEGSVPAPFFLLTLLLGAAVIFRRKK